MPGVDRGYHSVEVDAFLDLAEAELAVARVEAVGER